MADVDEDVIPREGSATEDIDLSDETQDFRFLATLSREDAAIPKRGEKDFEPHATALQSNTLAASRQAMSNALSWQRVHPPKGYTRVTYHPETNMAYTYNPKGPHFTKIGSVLSAKDDPLGDDGKRGQRLWLLPEEVLYLLERGTVDVRWPTLEGEAEGEGLPMSLQGAYAMFIGDESSHRGALTFERFSVYTGLKRMGYTVLRAPSWDGPGPPLTAENFAPSSHRTWDLGLSMLVSWWTGRLTNAPPNRYRQERGPLVPSRLYRNYAEIYRRLSVISSYDVKSQQPAGEAQAASTDAPFRITYHVWKPGSLTFKKSAPGRPDFRIAVVPARKTAVPTLEQLGALLGTAPYEPPPPSAQLYQKLKHGYRNVILAMVDQGVVSYLRIADAGFREECLYERRGKGPSGKRGGRGGRGRGR